MLYPCPAIGKHAVGSLHTPCICTVPAQPTPFHIAFHVLAEPFCGPLLATLRYRSTAHHLNGCGVPVSSQSLESNSSLAELWQHGFAVRTRTVPHRFAVVHGAGLFAVTRTAFCGDFVENFNGQS